jgi:hypothetical protein
MARQLITADDIGTLVTLSVRPASGKGSWRYVSGIVRSVDNVRATIGVMHYPTGPWDRWEAHETATPLEHRRIMRRA